MEPEDGVARSAGAGRQGKAQEPAGGEPAAGLRGGYVSEGYRKGSLPNGTRVVTERMDHVRSVAVGGWVETGSRPEAEKRWGMSHLQHDLVFKGTATRNATHDHVINLFSTGFQGFERGATTRTATPPITRPGVNIVNKTLEQVHLIMGFPGLRHSAPERYALFLLNDVIGGSMSSRLFQEVREREGLVYAIHSGVQAYVDTGTLYVYAATDAQNFSKVLKSTLKVIRELKKTGVTDEELRRAKDHLK